MTTYHPYGVNLSEGQKKKLARAYQTNTPITIRLSKSQTTGSDELMLTKTQINRISKAKSLGNGVEVKISKTQIRKVMRKGGSLFSAIIPLAKSLAPTLAKTLGLSALAGLASEGASQVVKKVTGSGQIGGFLIPEDKINKLIDNKNLLTDSQKKKIISALQSGGQVFVKPTKRQSGELLGSLLASIGIPLAIEAFKKMTGNGAPRMGQPKEGYGAPRMGQPKEGYGAPRMGMYPYEKPPPFYGGCKKKGKGLLLGKNSPFNGMPLIGALL